MANDTQGLIQIIGGGVNGATTLEIFSGGTFQLDKGATFIAGVFSSTGVTGITVNPTTTAASRVYSDDAGVALTPSGSVPDLRAGIFRYLVTADQSAVHARVWGLQGLAKVYNCLFSEEQIGGINGRFEVVQASATTTLGGYGISSGVCGIFATAGTTTIGATHIAAGVSAISDIKGTCTQTGKAVAFYVGKYDTTNWSDATARTTWGYGLYMPAGVAGAGIQIGTSLSSTEQTGHHITSGTTRAISIWADDNNAALTEDTQGINCRYAIFHAQAAGYAAAVLRGQLRIVNSNLQPNEGKGWYGVSGVIETSGTPTTGDGTHWTVLGALNGSISAAGSTVASNAVLTGLHITGKCPSSQSGEMLGILFEASAQGFEHTFGFAGIGATDGNGLEVKAADTALAHHDYTIAVWINGVGTRYIDVGRIS